GAAAGFLSESALQGMVVLSNLPLLKSTQAVLSVALLALALLVFASPAAVSFWRRYRRTRALPYPPPLYLDLVLLSVISASIIALLVSGSEIRHFWKAAPFLFRRLSLFLVTTGGIWTIATSVWSK